MKKQFAFLVILATANLLLFNSCKKSNSSGPVSKTKTQLISQSSWRLTGAKIAGGGSVINDLQDCQKDNVYTFHTDGTGDADENTLKCNTSDPQTNPFTWNFQSNETILFISTPLYTNGSNQFNIVSISESSLVAYQFINLLGVIPASVTFTFGH